MIPPWVVVLAFAAGAGAVLYQFTGPWGGEIRQGYDPSYDPKKDDYSGIVVGKAAIENARPGPDAGAAAVVALESSCRARGLDERAAANLAIAMAANIWGESRFVTNAGGDVADGIPYAIGWYQMNAATKSAAGYGYPVSIRANPEASTAIMLDKAASLIRRAKGGESFLTLTTAWTTEIERPKNARTKGLERLAAITKDAWLSQVMRDSGVLTRANAAKAGSNPGPRTLKPVPQQA
jgi:hypothetical protein